jgi:hypothetical protein
MDLAAHTASIARLFGAARRLCHPFLYASNDPRASEVQ